jgi:ADP-heptose:LPS heptosyltransferase
VALAEERATRVLTDKAQGRLTGSERPTVIILEKGLLLGDALIRVPAYRALRAAFSDHRIVALLRNKSAFADGGPLAPLGQLFFDEIYSGPDVNGSPATQLKLARSFGPLDVVVEFRSNLRSAISYLTYAGAARRYIANGAFYPLRRGVGYAYEVRPPSNARRYHRIAEIAAGRRLPFDFTLPALPAAEAHAAKLLPDSARYFGIAGGPVTQTKSWPRDGYIPVAARIRSLGFRPVILLGISEIEQRPWFEQNIPDALVIDPQTAGGDLSYLVWLLHSVAGRLSGCVANENGLGHLVATRGIPVLTLAGPTNPYRWKPITPLWWVLRAQEFGSRATGAIPAQAVADTVAQMARWIDRNEQNCAEPGFSVGR